MNKPAFWILSLLGPVMLGLMSVVPYAISSNVQGERQVLINVPESMQDHFPLSVASYSLQTVHLPSREAYILYLSGEQEVLCDLSLSTDTTWNIYTKQALHPSDSLNLVRTLRVMLPQAVEVKTEVFALDGSEDNSLSSLQQTIALLAAIMVYFFLFTYSVSLLKGVMEEKSNKVMDIILSSVSPRVWIMGKIGGVGLASLLQFVLWMFISYIPFYFFQQRYGGALDLFDPQHIHQTLQTTSDITQALAWYEWVKVLQDVHWLTLFMVMIGSMVSGFVLYAALFAMIGTIAGRESDAQPYVLPVTSPLILSFITSGLIIAEPSGTLAESLSLIPFTAPVVLTLRAGLGVSFVDLLPGLLLLLCSSIAVVVLAGLLYKRVLNGGGELVRKKI